MIKQGLKGQGQTDGALPGTATSAPAGNGGGWKGCRSGQLPLLPASPGPLNPRPRSFPTRLAQWPVQPSLPGSPGLPWPSPKRGSPAGHAGAGVSSGSRVGGLASAKAGGGAACWCPLGPARSAQPVRPTAPGSRGLRPFSCGFGSTPYSLPLRRIGNPRGVFEKAARVTMESAVVPLGAHVPLERCPGKLRAQNRAPASRGRVRRGGTGLWWVRAEGRGPASQNPLRVGTLALHPALCQRCCLSGVRPPTPESRWKLPGASHLVLLSVCPHSCTRPGLCPGPALPGHRVAVASHCSLGLKLPANEHCTGGP